MAPGKKAGKESIHSELDTVYFSKRNPNRMFVVLYPFFIRVAVSDKQMIIAKNGEIFLFYFIQTKYHQTQQQQNKPNI